jgi:hypothetical protein
MNWAVPIVLTAALLAACSADQMGAAGKSWCRNSPDICTIDE